MKPLRCRLGWHRWDYLFGLRRLCLRCWCKQILEVTSNDGLVWKTEVNTP